jgi:phosphoserine phosphatase RsbU/P
LAAVVLMLALSVFTVIKLMRPFLALVAHVRRVGEGELDEHIHLTDNLEMAQLSSAINDMVDDLQDHVRLRHSLALAMDVQQNLLPSGPPSIAGLDVAGHSTYCDETGGDYYDFLEVTGLSKTAIAVALGDVMGHGVAAAMLMATARGILRSRCQEPGTLAELLTHMNDLLVDDTGGERFMTMLLMTIDVDSGHMTWASAGHDPPIIHDTTSGEFVEREGGGLPLGISEDETYEEHTSADVRPGQIYLAATDGLWEAANSEGQIFGKDRLRDAIQRSADLPAEDMAKAIRDELARFQGDVSQDDDITFVIVKVM